MADQLIFVDTVWRYDLASGASCQWRVGQIGVTLSRLPIARHTAG